MNVGFFIFAANHNRKERVPIYKVWNLLNKAFINASNNCQDLTLKDAYRAMFPMDNWHDILVSQGTIETIGNVNEDLVGFEIVIESDSTDILKEFELAMNRYFNMAGLNLEIVGRAVDYDKKISMSTDYHHIYYKEAFVISGEIEESDFYCDYDNLEQVQKLLIDFLESNTRLNEEEIVAHVETTGYDLNDMEGLEKAFKVTMEHFNINGDFKIEKIKIDERKKYIMNYKAKFLIDTLSQSIKTLEMHEERNGRDYLIGSVLANLYLVRNDFEDYLHEEHDVNLMSEEIPF